MHIKLFNFILIFTVCTTANGTTPQPKNLPTYEEYLQAKQKDSQKRPLSKNISTKNMPLGRR